MLQSGGLLVDDHYDGLGVGTHESQEQLVRSHDGQTKPASGARKVGQIPGDEKVRMHGQT